MFWLAVHSGGLAHPQVTAIDEPVRYEIEVKDDGASCPIGVVLDQSWFCKPYPLPVA